MSSWRVSADQLNTISIQRKGGAAMRTAKQPNQRLLAYLQADRQWRRAERIAHARAQLRANPDNADFWRSVLDANGATARHIEPSTRWAMGDKDHHGRTGNADIPYRQFLTEGGYINVKPNA